MRAGDILLFHARKPGFMQRLIHLTTGSRWNHAAIIVDDDFYAEATDRGVVRTRMPVEGSPLGPDEIRLIPVAFDDEDDRLTAIAWAEARVGTRYGYFNAFMCGANSVLVGLGLVIKRTDAIICSELVAEALQRAGYDFGKDSALVSPGDLATRFGVER